MPIYYYKVNVFDNEKDRNPIERNKVVIVKAESQKESSYKLYQHFSQYYIRQQMKGIIDTFLE